MSFNISDVMKDMLSAAERAFADEWPKVQGNMVRVLADEQEAMKKIANAYIDGGINEEEFKEQLGTSVSHLKPGWRCAGSAVK